jgi:hypothetical protein
VKITDLEKLIPGTKGMRTELFVEIPALFHMKRYTSLQLPSCFTSKRRMENGKGKRIYIYIHIDIYIYIYIYIYPLPVAFFVGTRQPA